jgi:bla regulator protein blaR1
MHSVLQSGLANAAFATLLAIAVAMAMRLVRRPALAHGLWLLVLLKLVTPPLWQVHLPWPLPSPTLDQFPAAPAIEKPPIDVLPQLTALIADVPAPQSAAIAPAALPATAPKPVLPDPTTGHSLLAVPPGLWTILGLVWISGSILCITLALGRVVRFNRLLRFVTPAPAPLQARVAVLANQLGMRRPPPVSFLPGRLCPMLWSGLGRPRLLLPAALWERLGPQERDTLLLHELAHLRRRDHWVRWLELAATAAYWWLPTCWWARHQLRRAEEQCCDAWVLFARPGAFRHYAAALLEAIDLVSPRPTVPSLASGMGQFGDLRQRLTMLKGGRVPRSLGRTARCLLCMAGGLLLAFTPALGQAVLAGPGPSSSELNAPVAAVSVPADDAANDAPIGPEATYLDRDRRLDRIEARIQAMLREVHDLRAELRANSAGSAE